MIVKMGDSYSWWMQEDDEIDRASKLANRRATIGFYTGVIVGCILV